MTVREFKRSTIAERERPTRKREPFDGYTFTFCREGVQMTLRFPSAGLPSAEVARARRAVQLMQAGQFGDAFAVLEAPEWKPGRSGRPPRSHAWMTKLCRVTEQELRRADSERQRRPFELQRAHREKLHYDEAVECARPSVAKRMGVATKTVSQAWIAGREETTINGHRRRWLLPLAEWKARRVAIAYNSPGWRGDGRTLVDWTGRTDADGIAAVERLAFVRDGRPRRTAVEWVGLAREAGYLAPGK